MANFAKIMLVSPNNAFFHKRKEIRRTGSTGQQERHIGHFGKYHNTLCLSLQILYKDCFQFLLGLKMAPRENKNNAYAKFGGKNKEYYGIFRNGVFRAHSLVT